MCSHPRPRLGRQGAAALGVLYHTFPPCQLLLPLVTIAFAPLAGIPYNRGYSAAQVGGIP